MSEKQEEKSHDNNNDLEYNDGLGDLLREKERFEFSWVKTLASVLVVILVLYLGVTILFKLAKSMVETSDVATHTEAPATASSQDELVDEILATSSMTTATPTQNTPPAPSQEPAPVLPVKNPPAPPKQVVAPQPTPAPKPVPKEMKEVKKSAQKQVVNPVVAPVAAAAPVQHVNDPRLTTKRVTRTASRFLPKNEIKVAKEDTRAIKIQEDRAEEKEKTVKAVKTVNAVKTVQAAKPEAGQTSAQSFKVIAGSFITRKNAETLKQQLVAKGIETYIWATSDNQKDTVYRVQVGSFKSKDVAQRQQSELNAKGVETYIQSN